MGNHQNLSTENKKKLIQNINQLRKNSDTTTGKNINSFLEINTKESSSYRGIKTIYNEDSEKNTTELNSNKDKRTEKTTNCSSITTNICVDYNTFKIPTKFQWTEPAGVVYLTGSFSNWTQWFMMNKKDYDKFELTLELPRKRWEYKFIVDNKWSFSKNYQTCRDEKGNINNYIDTTNYEITKSIFDRNIENICSKDRKPSLRNSSTSGKKSQNGSFSNKIPQREDFNVESGKIPDHYKNTFKFKNFENLNEFHTTDLSYHQKNFFMNKRDVSYFGENISFSSLPVPLHINLNHLCTKPRETNEDQEDKRVMATSTCQRVKQKFITIIYYKPCAQ